MGMLDGLRSSGVTPGCAQGYLRGQALGSPGPYHRHASPAGHRMHFQLARLSRWASTAAAA